ncbi:MAG: 1-acyl-sn-glycerol-3-phosphate acyltransferase [Deltaproteobacteria bacterium]|nr:1-acyl-sn-glycerol-3-phosphate acyltransferase [Deltaproteobacteria bacterium]
MKKLLAWVTLLPFLVLTILTLCIWDVLLKVLFPLHRGIHKAVLDTGIHLLLIHLRVVGTRISVEFKHPLPVDRPLIVVSNHQSVYDIPLLMWYLRQHSPVFVAKRELGKWIPSVSCTLRSNGSVLIDRKDPAQAIPAIRLMGAEIARRKIAACIFPEGTRAREGNIKKFKASGVAALLESAPGALIVPAAISGSWRLFAHSLLPIPFGTRVYLDVLDPIEPGNIPAAELISTVETKIRASVAARS